MYETTTKVERNKLIIALVQAGKSFDEVQSMLVESGHEKIGTNRIWKIWKRSKDYVAKRPTKTFCTFCLENKPTKDMYTLIKGGQTQGRMCENCLIQYRPELPI